MANPILACSFAHVQETAAAPAYSQPTTPAESGTRERLQTSPATPWSLRISTVERVLDALESDDAPFDAYAALQCMPLAQAMRLAASRPAPMQVMADVDAAHFDSVNDTLVGGVGRVSAGEFHAVKIGGAR